MITAQYKKAKPFHKYCPAPLGKAFSTKFLLDAEVVQNNNF